MTEKIEFSQAIQEKKEPREFETSEFDFHKTTSVLFVDNETSD